MLRIPHGRLKVQLLAASHAPPATLVALLWVLRQSCRKHQQSAASAGSTLRRCGGVLRWAARLGRLLEPVCQRDQCGLAPGAAHERDPHRQPHYVARRYSDERIARQRRALRTTAAKYIAID